MRKSKSVRGILVVRLETGKLERASEEERICFIIENEETYYHRPPPPPPPAAGRSACRALRFHSIICACGDGGARR